MADYQIGDAVPLVYTISAAATVTLTITAPDGTITTPTPTAGGAPPAVTYTHNQAATQAGTWLYRFVATGAVTDAEEGSFYVVAAASARVYTSREEVKGRLSIPSAKTQDHASIDAKIRVATRMIDSDCQRHFWKITEARTFTPTDPWCLQLGAYNDLVSVTTLKTDAAGDGTFEQTWTTGDYQLLCADGSANVNAGPQPRPYTQIKAVGGLLFPSPSFTGARGNLIEVTGTWGWPAVPDDIREACEIAAAELFALKDTKFGVFGVADLGISRVRTNSKYQELVGPYKKLLSFA
jgi:hypothetical protein